MTQPIGFLLPPGEGQDEGIFPQLIQDPLTPNPLPKGEGVVAMFILLGKL
jgi:hypothetical protein